MALDPLQDPPQHPHIPGGKEAPAFGGTLGASPPVIRAGFIFHDDG